MSNLEKSCKTHSNFYIALTRFTDCLHFAPFVLSFSLSPIAHTHNTNAHSHICTHEYCGCMLFLNHLKRVKDLCFFTTKYFLRNKYIVSYNHSVIIKIRRYFIDSVFVLCFKSENILKHNWDRLWFEAVCQCA